MRFRQYCIDCKILTCRYHCCQSFKKSSLLANLWATQSQSWWKLASTNGLRFYLKIPANIKVTGKPGVLKFALNCNLLQIYFLRYIDTRSWKWIEDESSKTGVSNALGRQFCSFVPLILISSFNKMLLHTESLYGVYSILRTAWLSNSTCSE